MLNRLSTSQRPLCFLFVLGFFFRGLSCYALLPGLTSDLLWREGYKRPWKRSWPSASEAIRTKAIPAQASSGESQDNQSKLLDVAFPFVWPSETDQTCSYISDATKQSKAKQKTETLKISQLGHMTIILKALPSKTPCASVPKQSISMF